MQQYIECCKRPKDKSDFPPALRHVERAAMIILITISQSALALVSRIGDGQNTNISLIVVCNNILTIKFAYR